MRTLVAGLSILLAGLYTGGAAFFYVQERWARSPSEASAQAISNVHHPEATLRVVRQALSSPKPSDDQLPRLHRLLRQAPSFYQPPLLLAHYYANRVENPAVVHQSFVLALNRFPANGRLHLAFGEWLLTARSDLAAWMAINSTQNERTDPAHLAESYLRTAAQLEPALTDRVLAAAERYQVPPERWGELVPDDDLGRNTLLSVLFRSEHDAEAFTLLREMLTTSRDPRFFRRATQWALQRGEAKLGLEAALEWRDAEASSGTSNSFQWAVFVSRAHLLLDDTNAAYESFRSALKQIEQASGASSRASLELLCSMGNEYLNRGDVVLAESLFAEASTLSPSYTPAALGLARISNRSGNNEQAIAHYQKVLRADPGNAEAERELARLVTTTNLWNP